MLALCEMRLSTVKCEIIIFLIVFLFWFAAKLDTTSKTNKKVTLISV